MIKQPQFKTVEDSAAWGKHLRSSRPAIMHEHAQKVLCAYNACRCSLNADKARRGTKKRAMQVIRANLISAKTSQFGSGLFAAPLFYFALLLPFAPSQPMKGVRIRCQPNTRRYWACFGSSATSATLTNMNSGRLKS